MVTVKIGKLMDRGTLSCYELFGISFAVKYTMGMCIGYSSAKFNSTPWDSEFPRRSLCRRTK
jgi:hypothetical protein